jgi:hypothetical protein
MTTKTTDQIIADADKLLARVNRVDLDDQFEIVHVRDLNPRERRGLRAVVRLVRNREAYNGVTSIRFKLERCGKYFVSATVTTRRSDCGKYSPRALMCDSRIFFFIGPRGGLTMKSVECGFGNDSKAHFKRMLHCK